MVTLSTFLMAAMVPAQGATAAAPDSAALSSAAIGSGSSTIIIVALGAILIGAVGSLVAGDAVRRREATRRGQTGL